MCCPFVDSTQLPHLTASGLWMESIFILKRFLKSFFLQMETKDDLKKNRLRHYTFRIHRDWIRAMAILFIAFGLR